MVAVFAMNKSMARRTSLDLAQSYKITPLEVATAVFELPQRRLGVSGVKNIADFVETIHVQLPYKGRDIGVLEILR